MINIPLIRQSHEYSETDETNETYYKKIQKYKKYAIVVTTLGIIVWGISLIVRMNNHDQHLRYYLLNDAVNDFNIVNAVNDLNDIKIFNKYPNKHETNRIECTGDYCYSVPKRIMCKQQNDVPEESDESIWKCEGKVKDGYDIDTVHVVCKDIIEHDVYNGCILYIQMIGPWSGWSYSEIYAYIIIIILLSCICNIGIIIPIGSGGSHMSSAF